ncbi:glycosyltransferase family 4 protein [Hyunsoonleella aestuarii]|uniref:Glycosyltransferase family 4 protein n=1 Tax=Hyunsoonleella aestuarii TaxID=912802 RepID=A0ABP8E6X1_9FLAO|nr:glycosyltransferase family 4 protein [Hyunsoonleella aestuarii]
MITSEFPPQPGGIGNHAYNLALYLSKDSYEVEVIADRRSKEGVEEAKFDEALPFNVSRVKRSSVNILTYFKRLVMSFKKLKDGDYAVATGKFSLWNVAFCSLFLNFKSIAIIHGTEVNFKSYFLKVFIDKSLLRFDNIVAVSHYTKSLVQHLKREVIVIPNGININKWKDLNVSLKVKGAPVLTTVGRISERKGQMQVIAHLPQLIKQYPRLHYHCVGIANEIDRCSKLAQELGVISHITFHGSVTDQVVFSILDQTDIFIMLSKETISGDVEGFGIAILEANLLGVSAIGSIGCGIEDAINHGSSGLLVNSDSSKEFITAVNNILDSKEAYSASALSWVQQFNWSHIIQSYISILK